MLISVSGKINSGKDLIGEIILYLTDKYYHSKVGKEASFENWKTSNIHSSGYNISHKAMYEANNTNHFKIKKFADKLKDIVCLLIGCTREQLEDKTFKSKELGEEWWYFKGRNGSLISYSEGSKRSDEDLIKTTPRLLLQLLGTEAGRNIIHPNIWINALMSEYKDKYARSTWWGRHPKYPDWIITDMRFPNELMAVNKFNAITIRVNSNFNYANAPAFNEDNGKAPVVEHESETALDHEDFKYTIQNTAGIAELVEAVTYILVQEKLIAQ